MGLSLEISIILSIILAIAVVTDLRRHKVYNWLTFPSLLLGLALHTSLQGWSGLFLALLGLAVGLFVFLPAFVWGGMGAGDIKLMAVVGVFTGWQFTLNTAVYAALAGGLLAIIFLLVKGELWKTLKNIGRFIRSLMVPKLVVEPLSKKHPMPYAIMIAAGVVAAYFLPPLLEF
ncbi:prepilin peptidase [bacterium]|nr:prepilin peptidase [bacterium]